MAVNNFNSSYTTAGVEIPDPTTGCPAVTSNQAIAIYFSNTWSDVSGDAAWVNNYNNIAYLGQDFQGTPPTSGNIMKLTGPPTASCSTENQSMQVGDDSTPYNAADSVTLNTYSQLNQAGVQTTGCVGQTVDNIPLLPLASTSTDTCANDGGTDTSCSDSGNGTIVCPISSSEALQWIMCPILSLGEDAVNGLTGALQTFLYIPSQIINNSSLYTAYTRFRNIGEAALVIAGLVMVISQAAGFEIFAAYTVRKALPRLIIAAIGMALAWPILLFVITFFNDLGSGVGQLIQLALGSSGVGTPLSAYTGGGIFLGAIGIGTALIFSASIILSLLFTGVIALFIGLVVLAIRQIIILLCIIIAPLAIAAYVFPNTGRYWTTWKNTLLTTLLMFPIIMAFMASGSAISQLLSNLGSSTNSTGYKLLGAVAIVAPLFMLPLAFKMSGGLMGTVTGIVSGVGSRPMASLRKFRSNKAGERMSAIKSGHGWRGKNVISKRLSSAGWYATNLGSAPHMGQAKKINDMAEAGRLMQESAAFKAIQSDPDALTAVMKLAKGDSDETIRGVLKANNPELSEQAINSKLALAKIFSRQGSSAVTSQAALLAKMADGTAGDYKDSPEFKKSHGRSGRSGLDGVAEDINGLAGSDDVMQARLWGAARAGLQRAGRGDLIGDSWSAGYAMLQAKRNNQPFNTRKYRVDAFKQNGASAILGGKDYSSEAILSAVRDELARAPKSAELNASFQELAVGLQHAQQSGLYLSPHVAKLAQDITSSDSKTAVAERVKQAIDKVGEQYQRPGAMPPDKVNPVDTTPNPPPNQP